MKNKRLVVTGDRILLKLDDAEKRTEVGLYLPQTVREKDEVLGGTIVKIGLGIPLVEPSLLTDSSWNAPSKISLRYIPMEAKPGDYALFLRKAAVEIEFENEKYHIVPQSAILILVRSEDSEEPENEMV